ncbi:MAG: hypothetical protein M1829_002097, partial [Trizodia sp. TS-e1964]
MPFSDSENKAMEITEKTTSVLSLLAAFFVIATFLTSPKFNKPINRLVFYATWGNVIANVASLISREGIKAGDASPLCQTQAFLIQMFQPADSLWTLSMAFNVYLTFLRRYTVADLRALEPRYILFCYGLPFIPAITYLFVKTEELGMVYGGATLTTTPRYGVGFYRNGTPCALLRSTYPSDEAHPWQIYRVIILITFAIYIRVGIEIQAKRRELHSFDPSNISTNLSMNVTLSNMKSTHVEVTSEPAAPTDKANSLSALHSTHNPANRDNLQGLTSPTMQEYSVNVYSGAVSGTTNARRRQSRALSDADRAARRYARISFLFFASLLATWVIPSIN